MIGDFLKIFRIILLIRKKPLDNRLGMAVMEALADDAELTETDLLLSGPGIQQFPDDGAQPLFQGADDIGHQEVQSGSGLDHFPGH